MYYSWLNKGDQEVESPRLVKSQILHKIGASTELPICATILEKSTPFTLSTLQKTPLYPNTLQQYQP